MLMQTLCRPAVLPGRIGDVAENPHGYKDLKPYAATQATIGEIGYGTWVLVFDVRQGTNLDSYGTPLYRQYTVTLEISDK